MRTLSKSPRLVVCLILLSTLFLTACGSGTTTSQPVSPASATVAATTAAGATTTTGAATISGGAATTTAVTTVAVSTTSATATTVAATTAVAATTVSATTASSATTGAATTAATSVAATTSSATTAATGTTVAGTTAAATVGADQFVNPVINSDFPDPDTLKVNDTYYVYATNTGQANIQEATSTDLVHWQMLSDALPTLPAWAQKGNTWAPEVTTAADGKTFLMYFVARDTDSNKQCIGVATATKPEGPFTSTAAKPFICQVDQGGSIDPSSFVDTDGTRYLLWKNDGNCCSMDTYIYLQNVSADGLTLSGQPSQLIHEDQVWEGKLVEAPTLWKHGNKYDLFYSANNYAGADYTIGYALADKITGPYTKSDQPFVATVPSNNGQNAVIGPGGQDIVTAKDGTTWLVYHSWDPSISYREMNIDQLTWNGDKPVLKGPTVTAQKLP